jgi:hypothetical protein
MDRRHRLALFVSMCLASVSPSALAQQAPTGTPRASSEPSAAARWFEPQTVNLSLRYRVIQTSAGVVSANEVQDSVALRGKFKFDPAGRFSLTAGVATGSGLTSGWNSTGWGSGTYAGTLSFKQLYLGVSPLKGVDVEYGGLYATRGETTEVTNLDNDTYLVGGRVSVKRPKELWLDEMTVSLAYLGDAATPSVFGRLHRLGRSNYRQYLVAKKVTKALGLSGEYDRYLGTGTVRAGVSVRSPKMRIIDMVRFEGYRRTGPAAATGFGLHAEKAWARRVLVTGGYADIDPRSQIQNGDRYLRGKRFYTLATFGITRDLAASMYLTRSVNTTFAIPTRLRYEFLLTYNGLRLVRELVGLR